MLISNFTRDLARDLISRSGDVVDRIEIDSHEARALVRVSSEHASVEFLLDLAGLQRLMESAQQDARDVFPDVDPSEGGLRLVSVHLWEEIDSAETPVVAVGIDRQGEAWRRTEPASPESAPPTGDYRWTADREVAPGPEPQGGP